MHFITFMFSFAPVFSKDNGDNYLVICINALIFLFRVLSSPILIFLPHFPGEILSACLMIFIEFLHFAIAFLILRAFVFMVL